MCDAVHSQGSECVKLTRGIDGFPLWRNPNHCLFFSIPNRIQKGGHRATHALWLWLIFCAVLQIIQEFCTLNKMQHLASIPSSHLRFSVMNSLIFL